MNIIHLKIVNKLICEIIVIKNKERMNYKIWILGYPYSFPNTIIKAGDEPM